LAVADERKIAVGIVSEAGRTTRFARPEIPLFPFGGEKKSAVAEYRTTSAARITTVAEFA
jgi:hypothetical protein